MKITIIGPAHPLRGGLAAFNERLARAFQEAGDEVKIVTFSLQYPNFLFPGKTQYSSEPAPQDLDIEVSINSVNPLNWSKIGKQIQEDKPDLVLCRFWLPFMGASLGSILRKIKKNNHTKIVGLIDNIIPHEKRIGDTSLTKYFVKPVDGFIVMSRSVEKEMTQFVKDDRPIRYIPHPIYDSYGAHIIREQALSNLKLPTNDKYILFFGFIRKYKGLDLLLEAIAHPKIKELGIKLIVAGEYYTDAEPYEAIVAKHNLTDQVIFHTDYIPDESVKDYFCAADLVVQPYKTATQSGISQLAYHFNVPMLVSNVGGLPEIVEHNKAGYVVDPESTVIAESILDFYNNNRYQELKEGVIEAKKRFSWGSMTNGIKELTKTKA
ncbi:MAG: glycosyltransferase family 4 protein [Aureispira sp.]|nr:glycosyltransferase family 4 protein [Aureispira sp.]